MLVYTHNPACGVLVGGLLAALFFAHKNGHLLHIDSTSRDNGQARTCRVAGQVFFSSSMPSTSRRR